MDARFEALSSGLQKAEACVAILGDECSRLHERNDALASGLQRAEAHVAALDSQCVGLHEANRALFDQLIQAAARNMATAGDHRMIPAHETGTRASVSRKLRIGLFDNLANQAFITARAWRKLGIEVDLVLQRGAVDQHFLNWPEWEECEIEGSDNEAIAAEAKHWHAPEYVREVTYDVGLQMRYAGRLGAAREVAELYREAFGLELPNDQALLLAQYMGSWPYIQAMNDYDIVMVSMSAMYLVPFSPKPFVLCPLGGDLYIRSFEENIVGLLFRTAFRKASHIAVCETDYFSYIDRIETAAPRSFLPLVVDTDIYGAGQEEMLRAEWKARIGGEKFLLGVCRQDWVWKGSDKLIRAFARFRSRCQGREWRLLLQDWGADSLRSRELVSELGLDDVTLWLTMCSKPLLRRRQRAADVVADQFVMEGYGASVLEALAAGKPVIIRPVPDTSKHHFRSGPPPFVGAAGEGEIEAALVTLADEAERQRIGRASRVWVEQEHGYRRLAPLYLDMFERAAGARHEAV